MVAMERGVGSSRPLFITGTPRSGTSLTAGVLATLGLNFGKTIEGGKENPKGFFENRIVRDGVVKRYLVEGGGDSSAQFRFPRPRVGNPEHLREMVLQKMQGANAYKDAKLCLIWKTWVEAFPDSKYVIVRRDMDNFAESCLNTSFMTRFQNAGGWKQWGQYFVDCCEAMKEHVSYLEIWPDGNPETFRELANFAEVKWDGGKVAEFVDPDLWNRHTPK